ncbi:hypothetical protein TNCV_3568681 [Trichonephila clavipes]|nr:hypothetical protein TNCV_3568681 [Trichonephila clavipes]
MDLPYHPEIKATVDGMATHILSHQGQSGKLWQQCFGTSAVFLWWTIRNNDQLMYILRNSMEAPKSIAKQMALHAVKRCFAPP